MPTRALFMLCEYVNEKRKRKISEALKGKQMWTEEDRSKMSEQRKGRKLTEEAKRKMSDAKNGRTLCLECHKTTYKDNLKWRDK